MPRLFALDKNFPQPIVGVLSDFQADAQLVPIDRIDQRMSTLDDYELLLALSHHAEPWDGLITTDSSMLAQGPELAALIQTRLTLVVAVASGHNPVKASGLLSLTWRVSVSEPRRIGHRCGDSTLRTVRPRSHGISSSASLITTTAKSTTFGPSSSFRRANWGVTPWANSIRARQRLLVFPPQPPHEIRHDRRVR